MDLKSLSSALVNAQLNFEIVLPTTGKSKHNLCFDVTLTSEHVTFKSEVFFLYRFYAQIETFLKHCSYRTRLPFLAGLPLQHWSLVLWLLPYLLIAAAVLHWFMRSHPLPFSSLQSLASSFFLCVFFFFWSGWSDWPNLHV